MHHAIAVGKELCLGLVWGMFIVFFQISAVIIYEYPDISAFKFFAALYPDGTKLVEVFMPRDIVIDSALAADRCTGCRNFTIAHEAAHQILADLFPNDYGKAVKCRGHIAYRERNGKPSWEEWQADTLAAELLMPTFLINAEIERVALTLPNGILYKSVSDPNYEKILEMARRIGVSWSAIRIRLQQMQVIKGKPIHCHPLDIMRFGE